MLSLMNPVVLNGHNDVVIGTVFGTPLILRWKADGVWIDSAFGSAFVAEATPEAIDKTRLEFLLFLARFPFRCGQAN
jgi:hypothetical protein